jgi:beta-glucosidase
LGLGSSVGESNDKAELTLPGSQQALLEAIHATGTPVVLVCVAGRPYAITWADENIPAILYAWLPAQEGGTAVADVLFGDVNPAGKLPMTFPRSTGQIPIFYNHKPSGGRSNWHTNYVDMSVKPLYPFGHGLSYSQFEYSDLQVSQKEARANDILEIRFTLRNTGQVAGEEVVQLYLSDPVATVTRPVKMLKGFKRLALAPNEEKQICFKLDLRHLAFYNQEMQYVVEAGEIKLMIGSSSADIRLEACIEISETSEVTEEIFLTPVTVQ